MMGHLITKMLLLLVSLAPVAAGEHGVAAAEPRLVEIPFNFSVHSWNELISNRLKAELADNPCRQEIEGIPTMAGLHGDDEPPAKWITVRLFGGGDRDDDQAKLLVAEDDAYVAGFANRTGHWHTFRGGRCYPALPATACTELPFGGSYRDLIGGVANLRAVPVGRSSAVGAMEVLSRYDPAATTAAADAKMALAKFMVMVTEAARLKPVRRAVVERWEQVSYLSSDEVRDVPYYGKMSLMILEWKRTGRWGELGPWANIDRARCPRPTGCEDEDDADADAGAGELRGLRAIHAGTS
ncbi:Os10g0570700 [Oryza sativa Japonica Group]|uniref:rRNA N-glycosylase n=5 Tax=Oryza sativa subsp. japonica TaxID=39947 RepID=B9G746_ORYSJ|nr:hypothetical protein OsJ_32535 [Oryza sativa Japonica Group]KAF2914915.1 hypothetical protein DAI22_10g199900 [Oryza sativa Japonica Group]BAT12153.1 Os10g0570700 [Oryza sativa Japonica Group]